MKASFSPNFLPVVPTGIRDCDVYFLPLATHPDKTARLLTLHRGLSVIL